MKFRIAFNQSETTRSTWPYVVEFKDPESGVHTWRLLSVHTSAGMAQEKIDDLKSAKIGEVQ